ncbi:exo-beta-1,3-glucanase [Roridomyces roridus]|uniref:Exo-beta-1,3-glucanase n=1 Tax=Roridomyces roridus TaxID=1738132 RepID=A0AAD7FPJ4_9AGAR|nr:exo-beta-1,3-glucanase [Roridomyces roridus]
MHWSFLARAAAVLTFATLASSLGTSCTTPLGAGNAAPADPFWMQTIAHQGKSAFNPSPNSYQVFRNVKDFGAKGDGVTDDTAGSAAITSGSRCGGGTCGSSTLTPAVVFFPSLIGDAKHPPTLLAAASFTDLAVIDVDPYIPGGGGAQWYTNQIAQHRDSFRSVRNFVIDVTRVPATLSQGTGIHWQVAQGTSLINIVVQMSTAANTAHQGIWMENGSGGFISDLVFNGGKFGMWVGNQQFTARNITVNNAQTGVFVNWDWSWTYQNFSFNNCQVGFDLATGGGAATQTAGAVTIIDSSATNTPIFVRTATTSTSLISAGSLVLNNIKLTNVPTAVGVVGGSTVLTGGTTTIASWVHGNVYAGTNGAGTFTQASVTAPSKPSVLLDSSGKIFQKSHPQYGAYSTSQIVSARSQGAKGDGSTDDTAALNALFAAFSGCKLIFLDAGTYVVTSTLTIPAGTQIIGEAWSVIAGKGSAFQNVNSPQPVVQVGAPGSSGTVEITDILFTTMGPTAGAILVEWNVKETAQGGAGMWDSHIRIGGAAGTNLQASNCPSSGAGGTTNCMGAYAALHLTGRGTWVWTADHDMETNAGTQISVFSGRGILSESAGPVWMIGTASEHHVMYQYSLAGAQNHYLGMIQTETPYYQPSPAPPAPFSVSTSFKDPSSWSGITAAWALTISNSSNVLVFGAGLYSFFDNYVQTCLTPANCQNQIFNIDSASSVHVYNLATAGSTFQVSRNQAGVVNQASNPNGFAGTVTVYSSS